MKTEPARPALILLLLFWIGLLGEVDYQIIPPLLPLLASGFGVTPSAAARVVPVYSVASAVFSLLFGYLSDHFGRKLFIQAGLIGFSAACVCTFASSSLEMFMTARFLSGVTTGAIVTAATSYAADYFSYERRGRAMGILSTAYFAAAILGIPAATAIAAHWGWRPLFLFTAVAALVCGVLVWRFIRPETEAQVHAIDARQRLSLRRIQQVLGLCLRRRETLCVLLASPLSSGAIVAFITFLSSHLIAQQHVTVQQVGLIFLLCGLASLAGAPLSGIVADRWAKKPLLVLSSLVLSACVAAVPKLHWGLWLFVVLALAGLSIAFRMAPLLAITTELVNPTERGTFLALRNALSQLGIAASTLLASYCFASSGYSLVGIFSACLLMASTILILFFVKEPHSKER
ncbi:MAG: MFS transporter [Acidobacteria bacterium]|nr:MFS transporter [Acidobacteriota bacterium]MCI0719285.1 MFS transporter [Acidobacteriota bacterium]